MSTTISTQSGTTYTLTATDNRTIIRFTNASAVTVTVPIDASEDLADGFQVMLISEGAGGLSLSASGITFVDTGVPTSVTQYGFIWLGKTNTADTWWVENSESSLRSDTHATLSVGFDSDDEALGTITSGTVTPEVDAGGESFKTLTANGAFTLAPPSTSSSCVIVIEVTNGASAGAITVTGFTNTSGTYATTNANKYHFIITKVGTTSFLDIKALQ